MAQEFPLWRVELWGQSKCKEKNKIEALIRKNHLEERVCICGVCDDLESRLLQADICAFPSRFEGFPLALAEAMAAGLPCVGLRSASGVNLLIKNEKNGLLTGSSVDEFASGLRLLMSDACLRKRLGEEARKTIKNYAPEKIWNRWEDLLKRVVRQKRPLISVIMPVYNTPEAYLRAAAESLFAQTYDNWELIIADDCSDNDTAGVLESLNNPRIKSYDTTVTGEPRLHATRRFLMPKEILSPCWIPTILQNRGGCSGNWSSCRQIPMLMSSGVGLEKYRRQKKFVFPKKTGR